MTTKSKHRRRVTTLAQWFGGNRTNASLPGEMLGECGWVGVPFAAGMPEVPHFNAGTIAVNDVHRHVINLARSVAHDSTREMLRDAIDLTAFHPDQLVESQEFCKAVERDGLDGVDLVDWAYHYFNCVWMPRGGLAGTSEEFDGKISTRFNDRGGGSNTRFRSAAESLDWFSVALKKCEFTTLDIKDFAAKVRQDNPRMGLYVDAPWWGVGNAYKHSVEDETFHEWVRDWLASYHQVKIVVRYGDHPKIRELYSGSDWAIGQEVGRKQGGDQGELWITRNIEAKAVEPQDDGKHLF